MTSTILKQAGAGLGIVSGRQRSNKHFWLFGKWSLESMPKYAKSRMANGNTSLSGILLGSMVYVSLVGGWATPLKNMSSSIGMISNPIYGNIKNVLNHQPVHQLSWGIMFLRPSLRIDAYPTTRHMIVPDGRMISQPQVEWFKVRPRRTSSITINTCYAVAVATQ